LFPDDEFYDLGMREAVQQVASIAAPGAVIVSDATGVVSEYVRRFGRPDLESWSISSRGAPMTRVETWVLVQEGHIYFENEAFIRQLRWRPPWREVQAPGATAVQIYKFPR
jgi:hypothetical protein